MDVFEGGAGTRFGRGLFPRTSTIVVVLANLDPPAANCIAELVEPQMPTH